MVVNDGITRVRVVRVTTTARAEPAPSGLNRGVLCLSDATRIDRPTMPLSVIMTAAKAVSRASVEASVVGLPSMRVMMSATSITVTATASTREP